MKKFARILLVVMLGVCVLSLSVYALDIIIDDGEVTLLPTESNLNPLDTCGNHVFDKVRGYSDIHNQHTLDCTNPGCTAFLVEECYNRSFCGDNQFDASGNPINQLSCQVCNQGTVPIHNFEPCHLYSDGEYYHAVRCTNYDEYDRECGRFQYPNATNPLVPCTLGTTKVWRGYQTNRGHYMTRDCAVCGYTYNTAYLQPAGYPNYFDVSNDCEYCQLPAPYWTYYSP